MSTTKTALDLLDEAINDLEARLNLKPGQAISTKTTTATSATHTKQEESKTNEKSNDSKQQKQPKKKKEKKKPPQETTTEDIPDICKLEIKVGKITKVCKHPDADKLYIEEIDVGEEKPRTIVSGLRPYYTEDEMLGHYLLVISNLKPRNLVGVKSYGMVLCAASSDDTKVEFIEPPNDDSIIGEVISFGNNISKPNPVSSAQVEKKKIFAKCMENGNMKTNKDCVATWKNEHYFTTSLGFCKCRSIVDGCIR